MPAKGSAEWKGDVPTGTGTFTAGDSIGGGYTFPEVTLEATLVG